MKKIIFTILIIFLVYINPNLGLRTYVLEIFAPYIEFNKSLQKDIQNLIVGISEINKLREENFELKNREFVYVSKDFKERVSQAHMNEVEKLKKVIEEDSFFKNRQAEIGSVIYLDKFNSILYVKKVGEFEVGDVVLVGRFYIGVIVAVNSTNYEVELWNKKEKNIGTFIISPNRESLVVNVRSENFNTSFIENILSTEIVEIGDLVVTSSVNKGIPSNLYIGVIDRVEGVSSQTFRKALIKKPYDLEKSNYVVLIKND